jgi:sortase (surface protein transpeptidase)
MHNFFARFRRPLTIVLAVAAVVLMTIPIKGQEPTAAALVRPAKLPSAQPPLTFTPARLQLPKLGVDAPVVQVLTDQDGTMGSPTNATDIGWYPGVAPGKGNALFDSHHDWNGADGSFFALEDMRPGDQVIVLGANGERQVYTVVWEKEVNGGIDATDLLGPHAGHNEATLITCGGAFNTFTHHHVDRIVVRAELVWA